jgi:hypothetical protein
MKDIESKVAELMAHARDAYKFGRAWNGLAADQALDKLSSSLRTALESASRLPDGWVAVPARPTPEMEEAAERKFFADAHSGGFWADRLSDVYRAMLAARPEVPRD